MDATDILEGRSRCLRLIIWIQFGEKELVLISKSDVLEVIEMSVEM